MLQQLEQIPYVKDLVKRLRRNPYLRNVCVYGERAPCEAHSRAVLGWKVHRAVIRAKLEPYLGFLHSVQYGKPSMVCDLQELYRYLVDDFVTQYCQDLKEKDFTVKNESVSRKRKGKREYLNDSRTRQLMKKLNGYFEDKVEVPRIMVGKRQTIETLINEEALLLGKFLREEREKWVPRISLPSHENFMEKTGEKHL